MAMGCASEVEYFLLLARDLQLLAQEPFIGLTDQVTEVKRMLTGLIGKTRHNS